MLVVLPAAVVALTALAAALVAPSRYRASVLVGAHFEDPDEALLVSRGVDLASRRAEFVRRRLRDRDLAEPLVRVLAAEPAAPDRAQPAGALEDRLDAALRVRSISADTFAVEVLDREPARAAHVANGLAEVLIVYGAPLEARVREAHRLLAKAAAAAGRPAPAAPGFAGVASPAPSPSRMPETSPPSPAPDRAALETFDQAQRAYQRLLEEWQTAALAGRTTRGPTAHYELLRAADVPARPDGASPLAVALIGAVAGLALGLLASLVAEQRDRSVKGPEQLAEILPVPLLAKLPLARERDRK
jgi:capsular polysaccharide biosynthesis protein